MRDRVPTYPGRVKLTPVSGQANVYDMIRADSPTQEGDPINKSTLLKDATAALYGLEADAVPDDVLAILGGAALCGSENALTDVLGNRVGDAIRMAAGYYTGTGTYGENSPTSLTFDFEIKMVIVIGCLYSTPLVMMPHTTEEAYLNNNGSGQTLITFNFSADGKTVNWYVSNSTYPDDQFNQKSKIYPYLVLGVQV